MKAATSVRSYCLFLFPLLFLLTPNPATSAPAGGVEFSSGGFSVSEAGGTVTIVVRRLNLDGDAFSVSYSTADESARAGNDYSAATGTLTFAPYQTSATFTIT